MNINISSLDMSLNKLILFILEKQIFASKKNRNYFYLPVFLKRGLIPVFKL